MAARPFDITTLARRRALRLGLLNGALWSLGNSLTTGSLVSYLARDLGAAGLALSLVLAAPNLGGLVRLAAPELIQRIGTARRACLSLSLASYLLILGLPVVAAFAHTASRLAAVSVMIALLFTHQLLEYLGNVALWSWWADLVPLRIRGRYFGRRQAIALAVAIPTLLISGYFADTWREAYRTQPDKLLLAYAIPTGIGAMFLLLSLVPLLLMPATRDYRSQGTSLGIAALVSVLRDRRFRRLLVFRSWFSLANGVSQTVQNVIYPKDVLGLGVAAMSALRVTTQVGQLGASPWVGRLSDRVGNRPLLVAAQSCVAASLLFYIVATGPETRCLIAGAWVLFAAYAVHNICLPNLVLKLAPVEATPAYIASIEALGSLFHAASTVGGGLLFDYLRAHSPAIETEPYRSCVIVLAIGCAMRFLAVPCAANIQEPGARSWTQLLAARRDPRTASR